MKVCFYGYPPSVPLVLQKSNYITAMDVDTKAPKSTKKTARVQKRNQKPRNSIVFKKRQSSGKRGSKK